MLKIGIKPHANLCLVERVVDFLFFGLALDETANRSGESGRQQSSPLVDDEDVTEGKAEGGGVGNEVEILVVFGIDKAEAARQ